MPKHRSDTFEALRKKAGSKHGTDSLSSGAYFSDSPAKHRANNGAPEKSTEKDMDGVLREFEMALGVVAELMKKLAITTRENDVLHQENANALSKLQEAQKIVTALNAEGEKWNDERSRLLTEIADLKAELVSYRNSQAELNQKWEDKDAVGVGHRLSSEIRPFEEVGSINGGLQLERDTMQLKLESVRGESSILREKLEVAENELAKQSQIQLAIKQQKLELSSMISHLEEKIKHKESKIQELESVKEKKSTLRRKLEFGTNEIMKKSQIHKQQAAQQEKTVLSSRISQLQEVSGKSVHGERVIEEKGILELQLKKLQVELEGLRYGKQQAAQQEKTVLSSRISQLQEVSGRSVHGERVIEEKGILELQLKKLQVEPECLRYGISELEVQIVHRNNEENQLQEEKHRLESKISELEKAKLEQEYELLNLQKKLEDEQNEASAENAALRKQG